MGSHNKSKKLIEKLGPLGKLVSATALGQIINLLASPILSRLYTPSEFGEFALFLSYLTLFSTTVTWRLELNISNQPKRRQPKFVIFIMAVSVLMSFGLCLLFLLMQLNAWWGYGELESYYTVLIFIALLGVAIFNTFRFWSVQNGDFNDVAKVDFSRNFIRASLQVLFGLLSLSSMGMILGEVLSRVSGLSSIISKQVQNLRKAVDEFSVALFKYYLAHSRSFYKFSILSAFFNALALSLPIPLITEAFGKEITGNYSLVYRSLAIPVIFLGNAIGDVFHRSVIKSQNRKSLYIKYMLTLFALAVVGFGLLGLIGEELISLLFGDQWTVASQIITPMCIWFVGVFTVSPLSRLLFVVNKVKLKLVYDTCLLSLVIICFVVQSAMALDILSFIWLLSLSVFSSYVLYAILLWVAVAKSSQQAKA